jgi:hypothetical protein
MNNRIVAPTVRSDDAGDGHFGAPRGHKTHRGVDYLCVEGEFVSSPVNGEVTKLGYAYGDDLQWRYVEVTDSACKRHRMFYVKPSVAMGDELRAGDVVGEAMDVSKRYPDQGMNAHVHYEIIAAGGGYLDPTA